MNYLISGQPFYLMVEFFKTFDGRVIRPKIRPEPLQGPLVRGLLATYHELVGVGDYFLLDRLWDEITGREPELFGFCCRDSRTQVALGKSRKLAQSQLAQNLCPFDSMFDVMCPRPSDVVQQSSEAHEAQVKFVAAGNDLSSNRKGRPLDCQTMLYDFFRTPRLTKGADRFFSIDQQLPNMSERRYHLFICYDTKFLIT